MENLRGAGGDRRGAGRLGDTLKALGLAVAVIWLSGCASEPAPAPAIPARFAEPLLPAAASVAPLPANAGADAASLPPGYHCHWLAPGKRFCHGGQD